MFSFLDYSLELFPILNSFERPIFIKIFSIFIVLLPLGMSDNVDNL